MARRNVSAIGIPRRRKNPNRIVIISKRLFSFGVLFGSGGNSPQLAGK